MDSIVLAVVVRLNKMTGVLADLQVDGMTIKSVTPLRYNGQAQALVVFEAKPQERQDPYDILVWLEQEYADKVTIY